MEKLKNVNNSWNLFDVKTTKYKKTFELLMQS